MKFDAIVIGSGQAGNPLSQRLADLGWSVALVEQAQLGGTCVNTGCTPTKTMVASAQVAHYAREAARWGVRARDVSADLPAIVARKNKIIEAARSAQAKRDNDRKTLRVVYGHARFTAAHAIEVNGEELTADKIFIDAGARPTIPSIEGLASAGYLTNASIMDLETLPEHLVILGAGYVGVEFGQMFARFGSRVTLVDMGPQILAHEDPEVAAELQKALEAEGIVFLQQAETRRVERDAHTASDGGAISLTIDMPDGRHTVSGSHLLLATGRTPNTADLGLERAGIETDQHGYIRVNSRLETNVPGVWALGDIKGGPAFTHIAYNDYQIVWANLIEGRAASIENRYVPYGVFTDPELGGVGITEKEARARGYKLKIGKLTMNHVSRAIERGETAGLMKIVIDAANDRILGAAILSSDGAEIVQLLGVAMWTGAPYTLLKGGVYIHPTMAEGFWTLLENVKPVD